MTEQISTSELRDLVEDWREQAREFRTGDLDYGDGVSEGARSCALELERLIGTND